MRPDLVTIAKGLGAGYQAIGTTLRRDDLRRHRGRLGLLPARLHLPGAPDRMHAAGLAVQQAIVEEQLLGRVREQGARLREPCSSASAATFTSATSGEGAVQALSWWPTERATAVRQALGCMPACGRRPWRAA